MARPDVILLVLAVIGTALLRVCGTSVILTGSTGVLGKSILHTLLQQHVKIDTIYAIYRDQDKLSQLLNECNCHDSRIVIPIKYDLSLDIGGSDDLLSLAMHIGKQCKDVILINNAGVCLEGTGFDVMQESLQVNAVASINLMRFIFDTMRQSITGRCKDDVEKKQLLSMVNISSGDGELAYVHTMIRHQLEQRVRSTSDVDDYVATLLSTYDSETEYAYGDTPMYSLSKCILNAYSRYFHLECIRDASACASMQCRSLSICPGNFQSPMSTADELLSQKEIAMVSRNIVDIAVNYHDYAGGRFYRDKVEIPF